MLVLSRKIGEQIIIGDDIVVTLCDIRPDHVRIGIDRAVEIEQATGTTQPNGSERPAPSQIDNPPC